MPASGYSTTLTDEWSVGKFLPTSFNSSHASEAGYALLRTSLSGCCIFCRLRTISASSCSIPLQRMSLEFTDISIGTTKSVLTLKMQCNISSKRTSNLLQNTQLIIDKTQTLRKLGSCWQKRIKISTSLQPRLAKLIVQKVSSEFVMTWCGKSSMTRPKSMMWVFSFVSRASHDTGAVGWNHSIQYGLGLCWDVGAHL